MTIAIIILLLAKSYLNFGPMAILDKIGMNLYVNAVLIGLVEGVTMVGLFFVIENLPRKLTCSLVMFIGGILCFLLIFIKHDEDNPISLNNIVQLIILMISRVVVNWYYSLSEIYFS